MFLENDNIANIGIVFFRLCKLWQLQMNESILHTCSYFCVEIEMILFDIESKACIPILF